MLQSADTGSGFWAWLNVEAKVQSIHYAEAMIITALYKCSKLDQVLL